VGMYDYDFNDAQKLFNLMPKIAHIERLNQYHTHPTPPLASYDTKGITLNISIIFSYVMA